MNPNLAGAGVAEPDPRALRASRGPKKWRQPPPEVLPAWLAEMDFPAAPVVVDGLRDYLADGLLGYPYWPHGSPVRELFATRMAQRHSWRPPPGQVREFATVTQGVHLALWLATRPGDAVAVHAPLYGPFRAGLARMDRELVPIPMIDGPGGWYWDPERLERDLTRTGCRALLLVNPHNPTGRVFTAGELTALAALAERHDLLVISDEIHADLTYPGHRHIPIASLDPAIAARTVTLTSASKAFNLAGMRCATGHIGPARLRAAIDAQPVELHGAANLLGVQASVLAWQEGDAWLADLLRRLTANRDRLGAALAERLPGITWHPPEASYLAWLDCRALGLGTEPAAHIRQYGGVQLSPGTDFDPGGDGFVRLNFATSDALLEELIDRLARGARPAAPAEVTPC
ncbi:MalY/PatB family protein [Amycolatopsis aidingensis]|uniref:MalY/PatB family protein n=1 Tax=Amycolatopsis aidingensis TaxID=2842453 RepID=UPI001C0AD908|nr:aminotransferase class I/II-fold pyridoxal phosphate-dependent enzyme [Amycolatopsis aidingensis]